MASQRISGRDVVFYIGDTIVGGAEGMDVTVTAANQPAGEAGNYWTAEIVDGLRSVSGTITRAFLDSTLLSELIPEGRQSLLPEYTITAQVVTGKTPNRKITIFGCKFKSLNVSDLNYDSNWAKNAFEFDGTRVVFTDE